jgi:hypothetical protein
MRAPPAPNPLVIDLAAALRAATFLQGLHMLGARTNPHTMTLLGKQIATIEPKREIGDEVDPAPQDDVANGPLGRAV